MQFFWLYIDDFVGKGLGINVVFEFILYQSAVLVPLALPLAILLSSIMALGNLGESFELVAIKSAGISLLRFMRPLLLVSVCIAGIAFLFSNNVIPVANLKSRTLLADIVYAKPAFDLKEGVFYDNIPGYAIKIGRKENDSIIRDVVIYEQGNILQDNFIIAESGVMRVTENKRFLEFNLKNGWRYQENGNVFDRENTEYIRIRFNEFKKQFDLSTLGFSNRTADSVNRNSEKMFSMHQLNRSIDSIRRENNVFRKQMNHDLFKPFSFAGYLDSNWDFSATSLPVKYKNFDELLPDSARLFVNDGARNLAASVRVSIETMDTNLKAREKVLRRHKIEWHRKIVLSLACVVLFLIGAPLGSIIRKGGLGSPLIFAIAFFMVFYFSSNTGEKFAKEGKLTPFTGMWLATFILTPIGLFLIYKGMRDSQLFNKEFYYRLVSRVRHFLNRR